MSLILARIMLNLAIIGLARISNNFGQNYAAYTYDMTYCNVA